MTPALGLTPALCSELTLTLLRAHFSSVLRVYNCRYSGHCLWYQVSVCKVPCLRVSPAFTLLFCME